jgi:hypothetical protein
VCGVWQCAGGSLRESQLSLPDPLPSRPGPGPCHSTGRQFFKVSRDSQSINDPLPWGEGFIINLTAVTGKVVTEEPALSMLPHHPPPPLPFRPGSSVVFSKPKESKNLGRIRIRIRQKVRVQMLILLLIMIFFCQKSQKKTFEREINFFLL